MGGLEVIRAVERAQSLVEPADRLCSGGGEPAPSELKETFPEV